MIDNAEQDAVVTVDDSDDLNEMTLEELLDDVPIGKFHYRLLAICGMAFMADAMEVGRNYFSNAVIIAIYMHRNSVVRLCILPCRCRFSLSSPRVLALTGTFLTVKWLSLLAWCSLVSLWVLCSGAHLLISMGGGMDSFLAAVSSLFSGS